MGERPSFLQMCAGLCEGVQFMHRYAGSGHILLSLNENQITTK